MEHRGQGAERGDGRGGEMTTRSALRGTSEGRGQFQPEGTAALSPSSRLTRWRDR